MRMRPSVPWLLAVLLGACTPVSVVESPDPATIPSGDPVGQGSDPTGPITVLASDRVEGIGWRLLIYESADGECLQFETVRLAQAGCGEMLPQEDRVFGSVSSGGIEETGLSPIYGTVTPDVATVWLVGEDDGTRVPALLAPLDEAGLEGQAFIGFVPQGATVTHLQAVRMSGEIVETYELP
jgi:hypothetical protein